MCGITGAVWNNPAQAIDRPTLARMIAVLAHRGPDDEGGYAADFQQRTFREQVPGVALGHRRLAILDVAGSHQPLANENGTVWVVFNGEIYNYLELRRRLEGGGHRLRTAGDTETLVHLYEDEGPEFLARLDGMFALALWDANRRLLLLARDRLGEKPLVYRHEPGRLLFASELKSILEVPGVPRTISPAALDQYLTYQYVPHPQTIYEGIAKLPPGHRAVYCDGRLDVQPYWQPDFRVEEERPLGDYVDELKQQLTASVRARLQSDVPVGAFLSGGLDSSIIVGLMQQHAATPVRTFSIGFPVAEYDETSYARLVARHFHTAHEEFQVQPDAVAVLPDLVWHFDEPFADASALPTWYVAKLTRQRVTVALTGDGGDELFGGYPRYTAMWLAGAVDRLPGWARRLLGARFWQRLPAGTRRRSLLRRLQRLSHAIALPTVERYLDWVGMFNEAQRAALYDDAFLAALPDADPAAFLAQAMRRAAGRDPVTVASLADVTTYLPCDLLTKVDAASMAHALECRPPFLDHRVVELAARMPARYKFTRGVGKQILRRAFGPMLPSAILRRRKMGFGVPLEHWFRDALRGHAQEVLFDPSTQSRGYFRPAAVRQLWDEHQAGRADHSARLWALLILELWQRRWSGG